MFLVRLYDCIKWTFQAQWVPEPPVDPATLDQTFGLKDATCRPNLMRMQSKDKPPSSIGNMLSYLQLLLKEFPKCYLILNAYPGKKKLMVENGRDQPLNGVSIYILRRWLNAQMLGLKIISQPKRNPYCLRAQQILNFELKYLSKPIQMYQLK